MGLTSLSFLLPLALAGIPLAAGFVFYVYRSKGSTAPIIVPTLFLLRNSAAPLKRQKIPVFSWKLLRDFLLLLLITLGMAGLSQNGSLERTDIVIDNSLSMGMLAVDGKTLLDQAKVEAMEALYARDADAKIRVFTTCPAFSPTGEAQTPAAAKITINKISLCYGSDALSMGGSAPLPSTNQTTIFTDREVDFSLAKQLPRGMIIRTLPSTTPRANIAFTYAGWQANGEIGVTLEAIGPQPVEVVLRTHALEGSSVTLKGTASWSALDQITTVIKPGTPQQLAIESRGLTNSYIALALSTTQQHTNLLVADDTAWLPPLQGGQAIGLFSPLNSEQLGLAKLPELHIVPLPIGLLASTTDSIKSLANLMGPGGEKIRGILFHRIAPPTMLTSVPSLSIYPPTSSNTVKESISTAAVISSWNTAHPLTRYADFGALRLSQLQILTPSPWLETVLSSNKGPILLAGSKNGARHALSGIELFPYEGRDSLTPSIILINLLRWTFSEEGSQVASSAPREAPRWKFFNPQPSNMSQEGTGPIPREPGIVALVSNDQTSQVEVQNFFLPEESLSSPLPLQFPPLASKAEPPKEEATQLFLFIAWILLMMLFAEYLVVFLKKCVSPKLRRHEAVS